MRKRAAPSSGPPFFIFKVFSLSNCKFQASRNFNASNLDLAHRKPFDLIVQRLKYEEVAPRARFELATLRLTAETIKKSKCRVWCRLHELGSHSFRFSCTQSCTQRLLPARGPSAVANRQN